MHYDDSDDDHPVKSFYLGTIIANTNFLGDIYYERFNLDSLRSVKDHHDIYTMLREACELVFVSKNSMLSKPGITNPKIYKLYIKHTCTKDGTERIHLIDIPNVNYTSTAKGYTFNLDITLCQDQSKYCFLSEDELVSL